MQSCSRTVEPDIYTGSSLATGVTAPLLPTFISISSTIVDISSGGNLNAVAHLGAREVNPSSFCKIKLSIFITTPSVA